MPVIDPEASKTIMASLAQFARSSVLPSALEGMQRSRMDARSFIHPREKYGEAHTR